VAFPHLPIPTNINPSQQKRREHRHRSDAARRRSAEVTKLTTISAIPAPSLSRFGFPSPSQSTSGGQKIRASLIHQVVYVGQPPSAVRRAQPGDAMRRSPSSFARLTADGGCPHILC